MKLKKIKTIKTILIVSFLTSLTLLGYLYLTKNKTQEAEAGWWNDSWMYRKSITVSNSSGGILTDFQVKILDNKDLSTDITAGKIQADLDDLRFTDINGTVLPYWIEDTTTNSVDVWVKMSNIPTTGATVYFYYGNAQATSEQNGNNVFEFFDDFSGLSLNTGKWTNQTGTVSVSGGELTLEAASGLFAGNYQIPESTVWESRSNPQSTLRSGGAIRAATSSSYGWVNDGGVNIVDILWWTTNGLYAEWNSGEVNFLSGYSSGYAKYKIIYRPANADSATYYYNSTSYNRSGSITQGVYPVMYSSNGQSKFDYYFVRKYASTDPSAGTPTTEEKGGAPVASWSFDEGTGTTANDSSSNRNNGTLTNMAASADPNSGWQSEDKCVSGKCLAFDGTDDYVITNEISYSITEPWSFSIWLKIPSTNDGWWQGFLGRSLNDPGGGYWFFHGGGLLGWYQDWYNSTGYGILYSDLNYNDEVKKNEWTMLTVTNEPVDSSHSQVKMYINGGQHVRISSVLWSPAVSNFIFKYIGGGVGCAYKGLIDELKIYNYKLSTSQIKKEYNSVLAGMGKTSEGTSASIGGKSNNWLTNGLVGHWKMDEASWNGTAGEVKDASGNGNNGTAAASGIAVGSGKFGNGGVFAGTASIAIGNPASLQITGNITLSSWIKINSTGAANSILSKLGNSPTYSYELRLESGKGTMLLSGNGSTVASVQTPTTLETGAWQHLLGVYDGSTMKLYLNGNLVASTNYSAGIYNSASNVKIGSDSTSDNWYFNGSIDEARIYNRALSPKEVADLYNYAPGPVGYWNMDDATGTTAKDLSGNGNNGTLTNGPAWTTKGKYNGGVIFDGNDDFINAGSGINTSGNRTIEAWIKLDNVGSFHTIFANNGPYPQWYVQASTNKMVLHNGTSAVISNTALTNNRWYHTAVVMGDSNLVSFYLDGKYDGGGTLSMPTFTGLTYFGRAVGVSDYLRGTLDEMRLYNYARTQKQIVEDMSARGGSASGGNGSQNGSQVGYWNFDEGQGTTAYNYGNGGSSLNGTISGATWSNEGKMGKALSFDGSSSYVDVGNNAGLSFGTNSHTVSAWVYLNSYGTYRPVVAKRSGSSVDYNYHINNANGDGKMASYNGSNSVGSTNVVPLSSWHHVVWVYDSGTVYFYLDGKSNGSATQTSGSANSYNVYVGKDNGSTTFYFDGLIDEIKIYPYALTNSDVQIDYNQGKSMVLSGTGTASNGSFSSAASRTYCPPGNTEGNCGAGLNPAPVGEWKLDEGTGTTTADTSGNGNTGTLTNGPTWTTKGKVNNAVSFDGGDDLIQFSTSNFLTNAGSISAWVKNNVWGSGNTDTVIDLYDSTNFSSKRDVFTIKYWGGNSKLNAMMLDSSSNWYNIGATVTYTPNIWYHVEIVRSGTSFKIYINGAEAGSTTVSSNNFYNFDRIRIGQSAVGSEAWQGQIDDVKIYNYARTPAQVAWDYNRGKPVAWLNFDEGQGGTLYDNSGNGNNGTLNNMDPTTDWVTGKNNGALDFDGSDDYVRITNSSSLSTPSGLTYSYWINANSFNPGPLILSSHIQSYSSPISGVNNWIGTDSKPGFQLRLNNTCCQTLYSTTAISTGSWYMVTSTWDGSVMKIYINGILSGSQNASGTLQINRDTFIGTNADNFFGTPSNWLNGKLDDVRIYNYALSAEQVKQIYNNGAVEFR